MKQTERERILKMVEEGLLRPNEAIQLLAALAEDTRDTSTGPSQPSSAPQRQATLELQLQRPDGSHYTIEVPPGLFPMLVRMTGVALKEAARSAAIDAWDGFKILVRKKTAEIRSNVTSRVRGASEPPESRADAPAPVPEHTEARQRILQMVQNGRISASDAARLIAQIDALSTTPKAPANGA
ncbi:MAG: hypothetical protein RMJ43_02330 [Chloroherpetonaceae bacterium]|nr:hypothetical protein [Chthonomonadaceae bacterium]MDW8206646.1 hypothetical protein [Chloroherpetonaceae bacterium]